MNEKTKNHIPFDINAGGIARCGKPNMIDDPRMSTTEEGPLCYILHIKQFTIIHV